MGKIVGTVSAVLVFLAFTMWSVPTYTVWQQEMAGKARLAEASQSRQILIEQAKAELDSAEIRAKAIALVGEAAQQYPEYRAQEFMAAMGEALNNGAIEQIIYVPTENNIPITEANRLK